MFGDPGLINFPVIRQALILFVRVFVRVFMRDHQHLLVSIAARRTNKDFASPAV